MELNKTQMKEMIRGAFLIRNFDKASKSEVADMMIEKWDRIADKVQEVRYLGPTAEKKKAQEKFQKELVETSEKIIQWLTENSKGNHGPGIYNTLQSYWTGVKGCILEFWRKSKTVF